MKPSELAKALAVTAEVIGSELSEGALRYLAKTLGDYPDRAVTSALRRCAEECRSRLTLADILDRLPSGHPGPEEAWAMVAGLDGEGPTVVWTDHIARAWGVARSLYPDKVAARMAFLETYRRELAEARARKEPPRWWASLGWDVAGREKPLREAMAAGRLPTKEVAGILPPPESAFASQLASPPAPPKAFPPQTEAGGPEG